MAEPRWEAMAALVDPVRRSLYDYVRRQDHPVTREEAADAQAISRNLAAFHLDKLVEAQLLHARYQARPDQPRGRGRTPKVYEVADAEIALTVPERRYDMVGQILADAVADHPSGVRDAATREATSQGRRIGRTASMDGGLAGLCTALADLGFDPAADSAERVVLRNCPFHALAVRQPELICGLNLAFINGLLDGLPAPDFQARLAPRADACCVEITPAGQPPSSQAP